MNVLLQAGFSTIDVGEEDNSVEVELIECLPETVNFDEYVNCDKDIPYHCMLTDDEILEELNTTTYEDEEDEADKENMEVPSFKNALSALEIVRGYCIGTNIDDEEVEEI
ncbi:uncharacterized protein [Musca autumnalis]|uniref:uncharacterized protein n=1 Tax=Musca autumnalis TaxID=221902 RepID=UPI003CFB6B50